MTHVVQLTELKKGEKAVITELISLKEMRRRLQDIGMIEGTTVECVGKSPLGDPCAFFNKRCCNSSSQRGCWKCNGRMQ